MRRPQASALPPVPPISFRLTITHFPLTAPDPVNDEGRTPLGVACRWASADVITALLDGGADIERRQPHVGPGPCYGSNGRAVIEIKQWTNVESTNRVNWGQGESLVPPCNTRWRLALNQAMQRVQHHAH